MNLYVNDELRSLTGQPPRAAAPQTREHFLGTTLTSKLSIDELDPDDATCVICQFSLLPVDGEPLPSEDPIRLPCGHILGSDCATQWFNSVYQGKHHVDEDFNSKCPMCRAEMFYVHESDLIKDSSRSMWMQASRSLRMDIMHLRMVSQAEAMQDVKSNGGFEAYLGRLDELTLLRWYVLRHFEKSNPFKAFDSDLVFAWVKRTTLGRSFVHYHDWLGELRRRDAKAAEELEVSICEAFNEPLATHWGPYLDDEPELRILKTYTHPGMMPYLLFKSITGAYEKCKGFTDNELDMIRLETLDLVTWTIRVGPAVEDFPGLAQWFESTGLGNAVDTTP